MSMPTTSARWPRVHGSRTGRTAIPAIVPTRRSISRATAGASSSSCARYRSEPILSRDAPARGLPLAALSGLPRLLRRPDDLPDRDLDALGGPNLADPVAHELAAAAGTHHHAALGPDTAARPSQRRHRRPRGQTPPAHRYPGGAGMHGAHRRRARGDGRGCVLARRRPGAMRGPGQHALQRGAAVVRNETVGRDDVVNAVALSSAAFNGARIVGPVAAGLVIASVGVAPAFVFSGAGHLLVLATLATVGVEGRPRREGPTTIHQDIAEGAGYALHTPETARCSGCSS